jgi:hypothetical protein
MAKNKFTMNALLVLAVIALLLPFAIAEDNNTSDNSEANDNDMGGNGEKKGTEDNVGNTSDTEKEIMSFKFQHGAQVRLNQLVRNIQRNIIIGEKIIDSAEGNITSLEGKLEALVLLKEEIENYELTDNNQDNVKAFVQFKHDAIEITKQFRVEARTFFNQSYTNQLKKEIDEEIENNEELLELDEKIKQKMFKHNEEVTQKIMERNGIDHKNIVEKIKNQEIEPKEIREQVLEKVREMQQEKQIGIYSNMKEEAAKNRIEARQNFENTFNELKKNQSQRVEEKINNAKEIINKRMNGRGK